MRERAVATSEIQIANLLYRYAEYIDSGDFAGAANLFKHARIKFRDRTIGHVEILDIWERYIMRHKAGLPHTKHVITNPIIEVDEAADKGTIRSYYTVFQEWDGVLRPIVAGRYHDWFERVDGVWRWSFRDYTLMDLEGDMSRHANGRAD